MLLAGGWWIAIVELWPASSRPYIGGSQTNSILELTLGYNGLGRLSGNETGSVGGGGGSGGGNWGSTGLFRLFNTEIGGQIAWLLPGRARARRGGTVVRPPSDDRLRAALTLWLGWLLVTGADVQLHGRHLPRLLHRGPRARRSPPWSASAPGCCGSTARRTSPPACSPSAPRSPRCSAWYLLDRADGFVPWLKWVVARRRPGRRPGPGRGRPPAPQDRPRRRGARPGRHPGRPRGVRRQHGLHPAHRLDPERRTLHGHRWPRRDGRTPGGGSAAARRRCGPGQHGTDPGPGPAQPADRRPRGGMGGLLNGSTSTAEVTALLQTDADATPGPRPRSAPTTPSGYQLASEQPVMADRRLQRQRPEPDARAVPAVRRRRPDPLVHRRRRHGRRARRRAAAAQRDRRSG